MANFDNPYQWTLQYSNERNRNIPNMLFDAKKFDQDDFQAFFDEVKSTLNNQSHFIQFLSILIEFKRNSMSREVLLNSVAICLAKYPQLFDKFKESLEVDVRSEDAVDEAPHVWTTPSVEKFKEETSKRYQPVVIAPESWGGLTMTIEPKQKEYDRIEMTINLKTTEMCNPNALFCNNEIAVPIRESASNSMTIEPKQKECDSVEDEETTILKTVVGINEISSFDEKAMQFSDLIRFDPSIITVGPKRKRKSWITKTTKRTIKSDTNDIPETAVSFNEPTSIVTPKPKRKKCITKTTKRTIKSEQTDIPGTAVSLCSEPTSSVTIEPKRKKCITKMTKRTIKSEQTDIPGTAVSLCSESTSSVTIEPKRQKCTTKTINEWEIEESKIEATDMGYSFCQKIGESYHAFSDDHIEPTCSGRTPLCNEVLNDVWKCIPASSIENSLNTVNADTRAVGTSWNEDEIELCHIEDERYEMDMVTDSTVQSIKHYESIQRDLSKTLTEELLIIINEKLSSEIHHRSIQRIYGDGELSKDIIKGLKEDPDSIIPTVLRRLKQKTAEWLEPRKQMNVVWRDRMAAISTNSRLRRKRLERSTKPRVVWKHLEFCEHSQAWSEDQDDDREKYNKCNCYQLLLNESRTADKPEYMTEKLDPQIHVHKEEYKPPKLEISSEEPQTRDHNKEYLPSELKIVGARTSQTDCSEMNDEEFLEYLQCNEEYKNCDSDQM